jgi:hypothetical protein
MTVRSVPIFLQAGSHPAEETRLMLGGMLGTVTGSFAGGVASSDPAHGVVRTGDFAVTQNGTPNMTVNVAAGGAFIRGTQNANQGAYHVWNDGTVNLSISAADATNGRRDLVIAQVRDAFYSGATNDARITVVTGTPAASPADPSLSSFPNALVLARITVAAGDTAINTADITDLRTVANQIGKIPTYNTSALATVANPSPVDGQAYYLNLNTADEGPFFFNGTNYRRPWNMPWGNVASATSTSNTAIGGTLATVGISTGSFTPVANRYYRVSVNGAMLALGAALQTVTFELSSAGVKVVDLASVSVTGSAYYSVSASVPVISPGSSAVTWIVRAVAGGGGGTVAMRSDVTRGSIIVEDIGPSGAPT